jgi:molecular chaperone DnaJ
VIHRQGFFTVQTACPRCHGEGQIIANPCRTCSGTGVVQKETALKLSIPAGVDDGQTLRIPGRGHGRHQGRPGRQPLRGGGRRGRRALCATSSTSTAR